jgi:hypothetical protein
METPENGKYFTFKGEIPDGFDPKNLVFRYSWIDEEGGHQDEPMPMSRAMAQYVALKDALTAVGQMFGWTLEQMEQHVRDHT